MLKGKKFLLIDDSNTAITLMRSMLNSYGVTNDYIDSTTDSQKAIRVLASHSYDVVICDYNMRHNIDGGLIFDEAKRRQLLPSDGVFICVTGDNTQQVVSHFIELEPDDYLVKPFSASTFFERIERVAERKSAIYPLLLAVDNKEYQTAIGLCKRYKLSYPDYGGYIDRIHGDCLLRSERHMEAKRFYEEACQHTDHLWPRVGYGQALKELGQLKEAEAVFQEILDKYPKQPLARKHLAGCLMVSDRVPEALEQFNILHKVNSANPLRELIIANLYASLQQHKKAAIGYQRYISKVAGTSRYSHGVDLNISVSLMLASLYTENVAEHTELVKEARHNINEQRIVGESEEERLESEISALAGVAIFACLHGDIENCFTIVNKVNSLDKPLTDYYTVLNIARLYGFCGMPDKYEKTMQLARNLCALSDDDALIQSQVKLLEACHAEINQRLTRGNKLVEQAFEKRKNNQAIEAIEDAYRAFHMVPFHYRLCFLILELTALATPSFLTSKEVEAVIYSCHWVLQNDTRPTAEEVKKADELYRVAMQRVGNMPRASIA
ncbi:tetratricopeptide repeat-containing response regulator [Photobacterium atrarenae]|uniref:Response regulator n=1 Tax=Photobacterium atrarenae TaxID=865757 RepID=A0ABY5GDC2_9GAMM|nr:tetratricopeptide repeat-containing response regulator [Photobacterium atrarenae]UTV26694.1 response regulator [Photobacterium atrarenae]